MEEENSKSFLSLPPPGLSSAASSYEVSETELTIVWGAVPVGHDKHQNVEKPQRVRIPEGTLYVSSLVTLFSGNQ